MKQVTVQKDKAIAVLRKNRESHRIQFLQALDGWQQTAIEQIEKLAEDARNKHLSEAYLNLPRPEDHTADYDRVIQMLEMEVADTVEFSEQEFAQYIQDNWGWREQWGASNHAYLAKVSHR
jgi:hypothetical protein